MGLLNAPMTSKMKADLERMNALRAELEQLETKYADAIKKFKIKYRIDCQ